MAFKNGKFGKDRVVKSSESFIEGALTGRTSPPSHSKGYQNSSQSNEIVDYPVDRPGQTIKTAFALDNVGEVYNTYDTSMKDVSGIGGGVDNLKHSLTGTSAVNEEVGAVGKLRHIIIKDH